jgi:exosortase/archaeosortase family protein
VTFAGPVGKIPAGRISLDRPIGRAALFAGVGVLAALNAQADQITILLTYRSITGALLDLGGISAIIWFALYAALKIGMEREPGQISGRDGAIAIAVGFLCFLPFYFAAKVGLLLAGIYLFMTSRKQSPSRRVAIILLGLTGPLVWGRVILNLFAGPILALDAHIVGSVIGSDVHGNVVRFIGTDTSFFIASPCSSVHNISIAIVLWTTAAALFRIRLDRAYLGIGIAMVTFMFALNIARLAAIGLYPDAFQFLHAGGGAALFGWAGLVGAALLAGLGVIGAVERQQ